LLAKALEGKNVKELLSNVGAGGGAPATATGSAVPSAAAGGPVAEEKVVEEEKEESDDDMVSSSRLILILILNQRFIRALVFSIDLGSVSLSFVYSSACLSFPYQNLHIFLTDILNWY